MNVCNGNFHFRWVFGDHSEDLAVLCSVSPYHNYLHFI